MRLTKSRSLASQLCDSDRIKIEAQVVKPSRELKIGSVFELRENPIWRIFKVLDFPKSRVGAKLVTNFMVEITPEDQLAELELLNRINAENKFHGIVGRPTKKDRRNLDRFKED